MILNWVLHKKYRRTKVLSPCYSKHDRKIRKLQQKLAGQQKDSKRRKNTRIRIAKLHNHISDTRKDFLHKWIAENRFLGA